VDPRLLPTERSTPKDREMGSRKPRGNKNPFIQFTYKMLNSRAYQELSPSACKALPHFLAEIKRPVVDEQRYREPFSLSYGKLKAATGLSDKTCANVFRELVRLGFIHPVSKGGLRSHGKSVSKYKLSRRWEQYGQPGFEEIDLKEFGT